MQLLRPLEPDLTNDQPAAGTKDQDQGQGLEEVRPFALCFSLHSRRPLFSVALDDGMRRP